MVWDSSGEIDQVLDVSQGETSEFMSESIQDLGDGFRGLTVNILSRGR